MEHKQFLKHYSADGDERIPLSDYPAKFLESIKKVASGNFSSEIISKSKYTVRGSMIGLVGGAAVAMFYKKNLFFGALIGTLSGLAVGHMVGVLIVNKGLNSKINTSKDEKSQPTV
jgi:hypothetical protein